MMGILSILAWHFSVGRMCKPISPPLFQYLANRGGQACSKRGASVCSNCQSVPLVSIFGNRVNSTLLFLNAFSNASTLRIFTFCQKHQNTITALTTPTLHQRTMMCNNNNNNINININNDLSVNTRMRCSSVCCSCRLDSCIVSIGEGDGHTT